MIKLALLAVVAASAACRQERGEPTRDKSAQVAVAPRDAALSTEAKYALDCEAASMGACFNLAAAYDRGNGMAKDQAKAVAFFERACSGGFSPACYHLALAYAHGRGVAADMARAVKHYTQGCDGDYMPSCYNLAVAYRDGTGVAKDLVRAAQLSRRACDGGDGRGCYNLAVAHRLGAGVAIDHAEVIRFATRACDVDNLGCAWRSPSEGGRLEQPACRDSHAEACSKLAYEYEVGKIARKDVKRAKQLYAKACAGGYAAACGK